MPKPNPDLLLSLLYEDLMYGSPILPRTSVGYPSPSSSIEISVVSLLLLTETYIFFLANLFAFPIKFLIPY